MNNASPFVATLNASGRTYYTLLKEGPVEGGEGPAVIVQDKTEEFPRPRLGPRLWAAPGRGRQGER